MRLRAVVLTDPHRATPIARETGIGSKVDDALLLARIEFDPWTIGHI
jgi:hypothetical protein